MKLKVMAAMIVLAAGGAVVLGVLGDAGKPGDAVASADVRVIKLDGPCPVAATAEAAKCEGGSWADSKGGCLCLTKQPAGTVDGEIGKADDLAPAKRNLLVVCPAKDGKGQPTVSWISGEKTPPAGCVVAAKAMVDVSVGDLSTDLVDALNVACAPCVVTGSSWRNCPRCLLGEPGKSDCAAVCR
jgi:hypothetical protein